MSAEAIGPANTSVPINTMEPSGAPAPNREATHAHKKETSQDAPAGTTAASAQANEEKIRQSAELVREAVSRLNHGVRFEIDESTHTIITKVIDKNTNEVIRQIPSQEVLEIAQRLRQDKGVFLNIEA